MSCMYNGSDKVKVKTLSTSNHECFIFNIVPGHGQAGIMEGVSGGGGMVVRDIGQF